MSNILSIYNKLNFKKVVSLKVIWDAMYHGAPAV